MAVRSFVDVGVPDDERRDEWRRSAQRAWSAATAQRPGPVHVNLPFREPLVGMPGDLPAREFESATRKERALPTEQLSRLSIRLAGRRGVIVAGVGAPSTSALARLADALAWPVLAEPRSGARADHERFIRHADAFLRHEPTAKSLQPDVVVRFGAPHASK
ncbi:MAG: 2-succinyl-5-enolpyruvyl-6-hydroxy-3-cyclohexene-1-carboxylic-acid synthase, partial [Actinobacteria bacterium]|nr:2-succinyl-5-enolpyruvyl-6-hydroxy-3-cyclohexene-1-carboxylic-acid synthase [Actinomycetota bacterium]